MIQHPIHPAGDIVSREVLIDTGLAWLDGEWSVPVEAQGAVLFVHGSGSSRRSPRNRMVARELQNAGLGTLLFDLLTQEEELSDARTGHIRFDIPFLAARLTAATHWFNRHVNHDGLKTGFFGSSTGGGAALAAAATLKDQVGAVVSRGGRPDLAMEVLPRVEAPTLLIVGERDDAVLRFNREAAEHLNCESELAVVSGATHLFEEPGVLKQVARLAAAWFEQHLRSP